MMDKERALEALGHIDPELIERIEVQKKRRTPAGPQNDNLRHLLHLVWGSWWYRRQKNKCPSAR